MILIALGSSLPFAGRSPEDIIPRAVNALGGLFCVEAASRLYRSPAVPDPSDPPFVNAVVRARTALSPEAALAALLAVEAGFGRRRRKADAPRTLDLDLVDFDGRLRAPDAASPLALPHPRLAERDFVLLPLREVAPDWRDPRSGEPIDALIARQRTITALPVADLAILPPSG